MKKTKQIKGFSIIEAILYMAILGIILTVVTNFSLDSLQEKGSQKTKQIVKQDAAFVIDKITYEIENAEKINQFESVFGNATDKGKIVLNKKDGTVVTLSLSGGIVYHQEGTNTPIAISSPETEVTKLNFLANTSGTNIPKNVQVKISAKSKSAGSGESLITPYEEEFQTSVVSKSADSDGDGCLDTVDQFPLDEECCFDTDNDGWCDKKDNCPLVNNTGQEDDDGDGIGSHCDDAVDTTNEDEGGTGGGSCVEGKKLAVWIDRNNNGHIDIGDTKRGNITAYTGELTAKENYNYFSYSAHPIVGPEPDPFESQVFFYEGSDGLSFNFFHNIDSNDQSQGSADNQVDWWIKTSGNILLDSVMLSDDRRELTEYFVDTTNQVKSYRGAFHYWYNTDGGVIGPFEGEDYEIQVHVDSTGDLQNAAFYSANGAILPLVEDNVISSFIIKYETYEDCSAAEDPGTGTGSTTPPDTGTGSTPPTGTGGTVDYCALEANNGTGDSESETIVGGIWEGIGSVDSCIYTCNYRHAFWQTICQRFECFYTGNQNSFETSIDNNEYAGVGQVFSMESEDMYWKKVFKLDLSHEAIAKIDRFKFSLNYCHGGTRLSTWWLRGRCSNRGYHLNGIFDGDQNVEIFNYAENSWDAISKLETNSRNNKEIYAEFEHSLNLRNYINSNKEVTARLKFKASGAPWGDHQRWYFLAPARYLFLDYFNLETHVQALSVCGDGIREMDEQCDDGSHCSDGTDCTDFGDCKCVGIGDGKCKPRSYIGANCNAECLNENSVCGNGLIEENEECDDGNTVSGDGCDFTCKAETCGNGMIEGSEECDPGTRCDLNGPYCTLNAECAGRGDELCLMRDGDDDQCSQFCLAEICGNNRLEASEECDDGNLIDGDGCNSICKIEECLNGIKDEGEECDDGNTFDDDNCNNVCEIQECGDGIKNRQVEECDNGKQCGDAANTPCNTDAECAGIGDNLCKVRAGDGCDINCLIEVPVCGNGTLELGEECDDSNLNPGDGCSHTCMNEYTATYNINEPEHKAYIVVAKKQPRKIHLDDFNDFQEPQTYLSNKAYQLEFDELDTMISQALGTSYQKIQTLDGLEFVAQSLTPWLSYLKIVPQAFAGYGYIFAQGDKYLNHKFSFKLQENEYNSSEASPRRINYIQMTWKGYPQRTYYNFYADRFAKLYVWKNNNWKRLDTERWNRWWDENTKTLTFKINHNIEQYIDSEKMIHFLVEPSEKAYNTLATDFVDLEVKAYGYREGFE